MAIVRLLMVGSIWLALALPLPYSTVEAAPVTEVMEGVKDPESVTRRTEQYLKSIQDKAIDVSDKSGLWFPEGFFSGPHNHDIFLAQMRLLFGQPVVHVYNLVSSNSPSSQPSTNTVTLGTLYGKLMNSLGMLIILFVIAFSSIVFLAKRSMDISYLTTDKEEVFPFIFARGGIGTLTSFPIPMLGGMSVLQGATLTVIILGIGACSAVIRMSVPYTLTPGMTYQPQPHIARMVDFVLEAKTCSIAMGAINGQSSSEYKSAGAYTIINTSRSANLHSQSSIFAPSITRKQTAYFGANGNGDCGSLTLHNYNIQNDLAPKSLDSIIRQLAFEVAAELSAKHLQEIWENDLIHTIATNLNKSTLPDMASLSEQYARYREHAQDKIIGEISQTMKARLSTPLDPADVDSDILSQYANSIAEVGFMGLGSFYTMLTYRQLEVTQILSDIYASKEDAMWIPNDTDSLLTELWRSVKDFFTGETAQNVANAKQNLLLFYNSAEKRSLNNDLNLVMEKSINKLTNTQFAQSIGQEIIEIAREDSNGVSFPNPIIEMRTIGNTIVNTAIIMAGASVVMDNIPGAGAVKDQVINIASNFGDLGEKSGALFAATVLSLLTIGGFYAYIVPNIPYIMWSIAAFSYLSHAGATVMSAGWWGGAMALSDPNNPRTYSGRFQEGANILLTLAIKPTLMAISFFFAMTLNIALGYYLHWTLEAAAVSASYGGFNLFAIIGMLVVNAIVMTAGLLKNHSLIWELPDMFQRMLSFRNAIEDKSHDNAQSTAQQMSQTLGQNLQTVARSGLAKPSYDA